MKKNQSDRQLTFRLKIDEKYEKILLENLCLLQFDFVETQIY